MEEKKFADYSKKIKPKINYTVIELTENSVEDINNIIVLLNYCFKERNNFFVKDFNNKLIKTVNSAYNKLKTNILTTDILDIFDGFNPEYVKILRFILSNMANNYQEINNNNNDLCGIVSKESLKRNIQLMNQLLNQ